MSDSQFACSHRRCAGRRFAPWVHRHYIWGYARHMGRWPTRREWRFIIVGRWGGF